MKRLSLPEAGPILKAGAIAYAVLCVPLMIASAMITFFPNSIAPANTPSLLSRAVVYMGHASPFVHLLGLALIALMVRKCRHCRIGPCRRIADAMDKMSKGDLGWKITLRRGDELADVADSVTQASQTLADRIGRMKIQARQLTEIENYLLDSLETDNIDNPYTIKALRKLKICTSRLNANMEDFQLSLSNPPAPAEPVESRENIMV